MATQTTNYKLTKPAQDEYYNVQVFNDNADIIDKALNNKAEGPHNHDGKYYPVTGGDIKGNAGVIGELTLKNPSTSSPSNYKLANWTYSGGIARFALQKVLNDGTDATLMSHYSNTEIFEFLLSLIIQGKTHTPAVELYAEQSGENTTSADNGGYIDFHYNKIINTNQTAGQETDFTTRIIENAKNELDIQATTGTSNKAKLKVNGNQVYDNSRIMVRTSSTAAITEGVSPLSEGNIILVIE
jgi:hypothetical protein